MEGFLDRDAALEIDVVHQELDEIEEFAGLEACFVRDATFVHRIEFRPAHTPVEIVVHLLCVRSAGQAYPDHKRDLALRHAQAQVDQAFHEVVHADLVTVLLLPGICALTPRPYPYWLRRSAARLTKPPEHAVQALLLHGLDLHLRQPLFRRLLVHPVSSFK